MFGVRRNPDTFQVPVEIQIEAIKNNDNLTEKQKQRKIKKLEKQMVKEMFKQGGKKV